MIPLNIPPHTGCKNCGECCGIIPVTPRELQRIKEYIKDRPEVRSQAQRNAHKDDCPFRDNKARRCTVYPVRPVVCMLMGVCEGMQCKYGNSASIDGHRFLPDCSIKDYACLNDMDWEE